LTGWRTSGSSEAAGAVEAATSHPSLDSREGVDPQAGGRAAHGTASSAVAQGDGADLPFDHMPETTTDATIGDGDGVGLDGAPATSTPAVPSPLVAAIIGEVIEAAPTSGARVDRDPRAIVPALRARLERVIDRMAREFGYTVEVVEAHRPQARQDQLFAQGRSEPGPVVTWTRVSRHTSGEAVDVRIDGGWTDRRAFERLARMAHEEGLRSLWPRDPGHLELARDDRREADANGDRPTMLPATWSSDGRRDRGEGPRILPIDHPPDAEPPHVLPIRGRRDRPIGGDGDTPIDGRRERDAAAGGPRILPVGVPREIGSAAARAQPTTIARVAAVAEVAQVATPAALAAVAQPGAPATAGLPSGHGKGTARVAGSRSRSEASSPADLSSKQSLEAGAAPFNVGAPTLRAGLDSSGLPRPSLVPISESRLAEPRADQGSPSAEPSGVESTMTPPTDGDHRLGDDWMHTTLGVERLDVGRAASLSGRGTEGAPLLDIGRSDATERIARVLRLQDAAPERNLASVVLRLEAPGGGEDRVRVDLRGATIDTTFDVRDRAAADHLRLHSGELQRALERQGLEGDSITVRSVATDSVGAIAASSEREAARAASSGTGAQQHGGSRDGRSPTRPEDQRRETDDRSRERRQPKGGR
jgi:hypothetical protein